MEMVIFTPAIAEALIEQGYELLGKTAKAYYFADTIDIEQEVIKLLEKLEKSIDK